MKLAKALKLKNALAGEVSNLKNLLAKQNVRPLKQSFDYDNKQVLADLKGKIDELVRVKATLAATNAEIYPKIFRLAELKGVIGTLKELDVRQGVFLESTDFASQKVEVEYVAQLSRVQVDAEVKALQATIQALQDELDEFNFTRSVDL